MGSISRTYERLRRMPARAVAAAVARRCRRQLIGSFFTMFRACPPPAARVGDAGQLTLLDDHACPLAGVPLYAWDPETLDTALTALLQRFPESRPHTIAAADRYCDHVFDLLGSGPVPLGRRIDWHLDVKSNKRWPLKHRHILRFVNLDDDSDYRVAWELSRFQHLATLGKAYWYTADEKYAAEFANSVSDWIAANPVEFGINWLCPMEAAIRAVNWIWAFGFFARSPRAAALGGVLARSLSEHGRFIEANLEYHSVGGGEKFGTNHLLADLVGLLYIAAFVPGYQLSPRWRQKASKEFFRQVELQFHPDGGAFEASTRYHGLSLELVLVALRLCHALSIPAPASTARRVEAALEYVLHYTHPDGSVPQIGDCDDGVLLTLASSPAGHRPLLALGAIMFGRSDFAHASGGLGEHAFWLAGPVAFDAFDALLGREPAAPLHSRAFPETGVYSLRRGDLHMLVDAGPNGQGGLGGHAHNDTLGFELFAGDCALLVDPGTYTYTADCAARDEFRSTAAHNTVVVDGVEMNPIDRRRPFYLTSRAVPRVDSWISNESFDCLEASHNGYAPATHRRSILFDKVRGCWLVHDLIAGSGAHRCDLYLHAAPGDVLPVAHGPCARQVLPAASARGLLIVSLQPAALEPQLLNGWVSPRYGVKTRAPVLRYTQSGPAPLSFALLLYPFERASGVPDLPALYAHGAGLLENALR